MEASMDLAMAVHELGGALTPVRNALQLLQAREGTDPERERLLHIAHRSLERADRILQNVSTMAVFDDRPVQPQDIHVQPLLQGLVDERSGEARERSIRMQLQVERDARAIHVEAFALEQVVANLLSNALKFTGPNGLIRVTASPARGAVLPGRMMLLAGGFGFRPAFVRILVADTGIGISPETRRRLFQPFFRGEEAANVPGMGLGLTVSQRLVQRMRGDLRVESPKKGATLALTLPADRRTFTLVGRVDRVRDELHAPLAQGALSVAVLRRRGGPEPDSQRFERALRDLLQDESARSAPISATTSVMWSRVGVRALVGALSGAIRRELGAQADRDFEVGVRRASRATLSDALLLQTAVRCRHSLAAIARRREVPHVENSRRGR